ncbi:hypothetical protein ABW19_dt0210231 [Dactylella cylindrospora]|nr:hypothetical protein ABW19_dt0210231 [Dactylella cylindrospora]
MGCGGSKPAHDSPSQPARTAKPSYKTTGPGRTLGGGGGGGGGGGLSSSSGGATSSVPSNAGTAAAAAAARREEALKAAEARAKTKLKPQPPPTEPAGGKQNVTNTDTLAWN